MLKLFFDGGCRPNPGPIETAVVANGIVHLSTGEHHGSNGDAEWLALLHALDVAQAADARDLVLLGDSAQVVAQAGGKATARGTAAVHLAAFRARAASFDRIRIRHVRRGHNLAGIALATRHPR